MPSTLALIRNMFHYEKAAAHRDRHLDRRHHERHRARPGAQRPAAEPLLVGIGVF